MLLLLLLLSLIILALALHLALALARERFSSHRIVNALYLGLEDNWSQLRLASLLAAKTFLLALSEKDREGYWPQLLPPLCLNR